MNFESEKLKKRNMHNNECRSDREKNEIQIFGVKHFIRYRRIHSIDYMQHICIWIISSTVYFVGDGWVDDDIFWFYARQTNWIWIFSKPLFVPCVCASDDAVAISIAFSITLSNRHWIIIALNTLCVFFVVDVATVDE